jgi:DNA-binding FadR family transcriptional regulator
MVVREAMSRLKSDELIETRQGSVLSLADEQGLFASVDPPPSRICMTSSARVAVEGAAAGPAAVRKPQRAGRHARSAA